MQRIVIMAASLLFLSTHADAQQINSVKVSGFSNANKCSALGGSSVPPTITIRHSKAAGSIAISMRDDLSNGRVIDHGSTSVSADPSGVTVVKYAFLPPCNRSADRTSTYSFTVTGSNARSVKWATVAPGGR
ncbi:hypothetical protein GJW-30_1_02657 [Variibacter gotjawalensis]|uniref:Uncharacterized protein n=1 Tax=Variibacter gotjawalensis TaxID=1333996 RepID=A0A0S3PW03_9BRAD|nr:hypothetical protein [Variibacter gotjawalensis]NIK45948.1 hypothetical protein [Variibacter gotjawalensis]RZS47866.1 hypothetical protein EV661_0260 [Variibacter gotjawalensis]BAT60122.1 hypothetical protein GJW-30_1_02657 [Variibacter gotjawalensis]